MPRNAVKKLINDVVCLPIQTAKTTTVTETIIVIQSTTPTKTITTQQGKRREKQGEQTELEKEKQGQQQKQSNKRGQRRKRRSKKRSKKLTTTTCSTITVTPKTIETSTRKASGDKKPLKSRSATSKKLYSPPYFSTLYPIVIETCFELESLTASGNSKAGSTGSSIKAVGAGGTCVIGVTSTQRLNNTCRRQLRRRRSVTNFTNRKHRAKAKAAAAAASPVLKVRGNSKETAARLATLRNRKKVEESSKDKKKQKVGNNNCELQVKRHAAWYNLNEALLNKIEPLEVEVKKSGSKRKRDSSVAAARKRNSINLKHTPPPAVHLSPASFDFITLPCVGAPAAEISAGPSIVKTSESISQANATQTSSTATAVSVELTDVATSTSTATTATKGVVAVTKAAISNSASSSSVSSGSSKKRARGGMSLYERRYQTTDAEPRSGASVVTNGYLSSTRTSSASSSAVHSDADNTQDITQQYYMPVASVSSSGLAGSSSSGSGVIAAVPLGNGSALNHAPSMATLCNIGNTCYLNSVVYTLRFAPQFLHNLHHLIVDLSSIQQCIARQRAAKSSSLGRGISAVQLENARSWSSKDLAALEQNALMNVGVGGVGGCGGGIGQKSSHQMLTERLHELYQCLHRNELAESTEPFHADTLLHAVQDVNAIFEGNQQQDAHEFLMCLLNSIRETCQLLIKAIGEYPDLIMNGYIRNPDELDTYTIERDALGGANATPSSSNAHGGSGAPGASNATNSSSSSLSTSNITKASFFSRKSKRKEESKNSKNSRLQSPLKDGQSGGIQATSNSLFYLNSVDLSGASSNNASTTSATATVSASASSPSTTVKGLSVSTTGNDSKSELSSPVMLKDKERLAEKIRELGLDFFSEDFEGVTVSTTKCLSCETVTEQKESMIDIAVPVPISGYDNADLTDKPSAFIQNSCVTREFFRGENKYRCEQCTGYTEAIRSISYEVLPRLLVIQLSRFSGGMEKINSYIPTSFTLQCFCAKCCELSDANKLHIYKLYSVITHVGATMSVGHYIAYTCSLDWANEYVNCPKDRRNANINSGSQQMGLQANGLSNNSLYPLGGGVGSAASGGGSTPNERSSPGTQAASAASAAASALASSGSSLMKKMKFGRSKASSSGDMSKNMKNLNGITSKVITNGIGKLSMNTTCHSLTCCATRICSVQQQQLQQHQLSASNNELSEETLPNGSNHASASMSISGSSNAGGGGGSGTGSGGSSTTSGYSSYPVGYGSTGRGGTKASACGGYASSCGSLSAMGSSNGEPIWYMCDDDKIKAMTQREFEELLSPARKITVTPYLLFYARFDLQTSTPPSAKSTSTAAQQSSWSNENLTLNPGATAAALHKM
ncbi:pneumococcal serine-rich repeat protein [Anastrepha obliqua]|uniref:pneumococcal serine-rich repeat protein n=1 Tax=Anastrepha obliqua TaxID=95512 RepID=UPI00240A5A05|nr:pneumococcal serine-rich repeat protein [Anastrepha obliqua]XP_054747907.1 pneumococcal serine-rich repeat protein [Anastrepha obliqua]